MKDLMQDLASYTRSELNVPYKQRRDKMLRAPSYPLMEKVLKALAGFRKILGDDLNDFQKLCLLYQMICEAGTYDWTRRKSLSHSFLGALKGVAVCAGYAELFVLLVGDLTESYTPYFIIGYTGNDISLVKESENSHAWVIIQDKNSGRAWHCDPTWDLGAKQYRYFFKTDKEMTGRIWAAKCLPACAESFTGHIYTNREKLALLVDYYKSMPQRFESGNFTVG